MNDVILSDEEIDMTYTDKNWLIVCDDYQEMFDSIMGMYCCRIRLYESFKRSRGHIWLNKDHGIEMAYNIIGKNKYHIGRWEHARWNRIKREIDLICQRTLIVEKGWLDLVRRDLMIT